MGDLVEISVVMPTMNKAGLLDRVLAALAAQQVPPGVLWEVIVVNDGSTDRTSEVLLGRQAGFPVPLRIVNPGHNVGRARARNLGLAAATGRWVLFLDDDILAPPDLLTAHLGLLRADDNAGTIGFAVTDKTLVDAPHFYYLDTRGVARLGSGNAPGRYFVTQNAAAPRWALEKVGGFQAEFSGYGFEDMELAFRLEDQCGICFRALTTVAPRHIHHHTLADYLAKKAACGESSLPLLARLHPQRLREMKLHLVIDACGERPPFGVALLRGLLDSPLGLIPAWLAAHWPCGKAFRPYGTRAYQQVMNIAILSCYRKGLRGGNPCQKSAKKLPN